ncbi:MAG: hypothetical protein B6230_02945 [Desulfobacteraceae bacterium 4572_89]|nr:MAG: hypothetical protein B6230_02945 [Desulfobacteraceae bacterium 4572_89]
MLTTTSNINFFSGYQDQLNFSTRVTGHSFSKNQNTINDEVNLSQKAKELQQVYAKKEATLEQKYKNESQNLEREYLQEKNRVEKEFRQKKQALEIDLYV